MRRTTQLLVLKAAALAALVLTSMALAVPPQPPGACIFKDGSCQVIPGNICKLSKGRFLGPDTTCP